MSTKDVYSYPQYCRIAYNWNRNPECDFIEECIRRYSLVEVNSILDIACGPGIHLEEFARRGYEVLGLDKSKEMSEFVNKKAKEAGLNFKCARLDMRGFNLEEKFECAICMLDSFRYLLADRDILLHLNSVAEVLRAGGLYILDFWMPKDKNAIEWEDAHWVREDQDITIDATYRQHADTFNQKSKIFEDELVFRIKGPKFNATINGRAKTRVLFQGEFEKLINDCGAFEFIGRFYNFDFELKEDYNIKTMRTIIILRRKGE